MIEATMIRIAVALETIATKFGAAAPAAPVAATVEETKTRTRKPKDETPATPAAVEVVAPAAVEVVAPAVTIEDVRAVGNKLIAMNKVDDINKILAAAGGKLTTLKAEQYPAVLKSFQELLATAQKDPLS